MQTKEYISLKEFQSKIKSSLESNFALAQWVTAEIGEMKVNYSGHCYLELIEKGGKNAVPSAKANAVIWRSHYGALSAYFRSETGCELALGMRVLLKISVNYHELYGISMVISDINPSYTLGEQAAQRQKTIDQLQREGVYDMNKQLELPRPAQRLAVVSSRNAAGFGDFMGEIEASRFFFELTLFDAFMQGAGAEQSIIDALDKIMLQGEDFDAVILIRGGGSQSDLSCFNSYDLCSVLAQFPLPIIAGIGHDRDQSVADLVACLSLKTPTAVAGFLIDELSSFDAYLNQTMSQLELCAQKIIAREKNLLERQTFALSHLQNKLALSLNLKLQSLEKELFKAAQARISAERSRIENKELNCENLRPEKILSLGFSLVKFQGKTLRHGGGLKQGDELEIIMSEGKLSALVKK